MNPAATMRVALGQIPTPDEDFLLFARQLGLSGVQFNTPQLPGTQRWEYAVSVPSSV